MAFDEKAYVTREDDFMKRRRVRRIERVFGYACIVFSGVFFTFEPSNVVAQVVSPWVETAFSTGMIFGGLACFAGSASDRWVGEYGGIPLLSSVVFLYAATSFAAAFEGDGRSRIVLLGFGCIMAAYGWSLIGRWKDVRDIKWWAQQPDGYQGDEE